MSEALSDCTPHPSAAERRRLLGRCPLPAVAATAFVAALGSCDSDPVVEPVPSLEIVPDSVTLTHLGQQFLFTVRGAGPGAGAVRWSSRDAAVATVDASGTVTAHGNGVADVQAWTPTSSDQAKVRVRQTAAALEPFGEGQRTTPAQPLLEPVGVRVLDAGGTPAAGTAVRFEPGPGSGQVEPREAASDSAGMAVVEWTLGPQPGRQVLRAVAPEGGASVEIAATALDPDEAAASWEVRSGEDQWALAGHALPDPVAVRVLDAAGRPVRGASVRFEPEAGSGRADPDVAATDSAGLASAVWTLGDDRLGAQRLVVSVADKMTLAFEATAVSDEGICNRTPIVSREIVTRLVHFHRAQVSGCEEVTEEMLGTVEILNLAEKGINRLRSGDFDGLVALRDLYLHNNRLVGLPARIFKGLTRLERLDLNGNELTTLSEGVFTDPPRLERLGLDNNRLEALPPGIFKGLTELKSLDLRGNRLARLPPGIFKGLSNLESLFVWGNRLTELAPATFSGLDALETLRFDNNELTELPEDLFEGLSNLVLLTMRANRLNSLPDGILAGLLSLESLVIGDNALATLPPGLFSETPRLGRVFLDGNQLTALPRRLFSENPALQRLYLQWNDLTGLPPGIFDRLPNLVRLDLSWNDLAELPPGIFKGTPKLAQLSLEGNELEALSPGLFAGLAKLEWVTLERNPGAPFAVKPELVRLDADDLLSPGPATAAVLLPLGAPFAFDIPVSVQQGTISREIVSVLPGDTMSVPFVVTGTSAGVAAHVGFGPPPEVTAGAYTGLAVARGEDLVLFAESDNRSPFALSPVPAHRMQAGGPSAELVLGDHFGDPDGDTLTYEAAATVAGVVQAVVEDGVLRLDPLSVDTTEVEVTATDPGGLRAKHRFRTWVVPEPDPDAFNIELYIEPGFTPEEEAAIRRAADRWMEAVTGDLPDVPVQGSMADYCSWSPPNLRLVGVVDDVLIHMSLVSHLSGNVAAAITCGRRETGHEFMAVNEFALWYVRGRGGGIESLYESALHEIGHVLGFGDWRWGSSPPGWKALFHHGDGDGHFAGPLAVAAFDAAGGAGYAGGKVPLEDRIPVRNIHWRRSVIRADIMAPGSGSLLTAITLQALADLGHEVDLSKADPYTLPGQAQADAQGVAADAEEAVAELFADDVIRGPVVVVDENGKVVRVIRP